MFIMSRIIHFRGKHGYESHYSISDCGHCYSSYYSDPEAAESCASRTSGTFSQRRRARIAGVQEHMKGFHAVISFCVVTRVLLLLDDDDDDYYHCLGD